jgi:hypothetical protein
MSKDAGKPKRSGWGAITVFRTALAALAASLVLLLLIVFLIFRTTTPARVAVREPAVAKVERVVEPVRQIEPEPERVTPSDLLPQRVTPVERVTAPVAVANAERVSVSEPSGSTNSKALDDSFCARYGLHKVVTRGGRSWRCQK